MTWDLFGVLYQATRSQCYLVATRPLSQLVDFRILKPGSLSSQTMKGGWVVEEEGGGGGE